MEERDEILRRIKEKIAPLEIECHNACMEVSERALRSPYTPSHFLNFERQREVVELRYYQRVADALTQKEYEIWRDEIKQANENSAGLTQFVQSLEID